MSSTQIEHIPEIMSLEPVQVTTFFNNATYAFMLGWDDGYKDLEMSFIEDDLNIRHTSWIVTTGMQEKRLRGLDQLFRGHDIQSHSAFHVPHDEINESYCAEILEQSIAFIQSFYGYTPIVFACPYGRVGSNYKTVLEYFEVGRGMHLEGDSSRGRWPITSRGKCDTSFIVNQYDTRYLSQKV
ncbi:MAG: polysaccharide deacetylase family protein, partial [Candidatus Thorarchaeota archaeon]